MNIRVLIGCEKSGVIRRAFRARGCEAYSCDICPADDQSPFHICGDLLAILHGIDGKAWDIIIAHPPCRFVSVSGMHWTTRGFRDPKLTEEAIAFAEAIWRAPAKRICIENPASVLSTRSILGKPKQTIQPHEFGDDASKKTCLWLKNLPPVMPTHVSQDWFAQEPPAGRLVDGVKRYANQTDSGQNKLGPSPTRAADRAKTYNGIAEAMAEQWSKLK